MDEVTLSLANKNTIRKIQDTLVRGSNKLSLTIDSKEDVKAPFSYLVGLEVTDYVPGRRMLSNPPWPPDKDGVLMTGNGVIVSYGSMGGVVDKSLLGISSEDMEYFCPSFFYDNRYALLAYAFEETHDTMGAGIVLAPGWYAVNTDTFAYEPFDPKEHPFVLCYGIAPDEVVGNAGDYLKALFPLRERISFTVTSDNIQTDGDDLAFVVWKRYDHFALDDNSLAYMGAMDNLMSFRYLDSTLKVFQNNKTVIIQYHPSQIVLTGADGIKYAIQVDSSGALTATPIE